MDFAEDLAHHLADHGFGEYGVDIRTIVNFDMTGQLRGILVENTASGTAPDITTGMDEAMVDITICLDYGPRGRDRTARRAFQIYRHLAIQHDVWVGDTLYRRISAETPPYELWQDGRYYQILRVSMMRYYEAIM